ncbi:MAG: aminoacyl-tRNA hydrolase [Alphaproteobacteria bacterium]|nr:aminoacyl-tRNA hydrolase [Alphaproteobacteria bacterium]
MLIVGLGNPGKQYESTRHNVGFMVMDRVASEYGFPAFKEKFQGLFSEGMVAGQKVYLLKPLTFMNLSGQSVRSCCQFFRIPTEKLVVVHDDLDLTCGKIRVKNGGGNGGHNGLKSIDSCLDVNYTRIRFGIDHPGHAQDVAHYVLSSFSKEERGIVDDVIKHISQFMSLILTGDYDHFMSKVAQSKSV